MSTPLTPIVYPPYPVAAIEEVDLPYETPPVEETAATTPSRAVESEEDRPREDYPTSPDATAISNTARAMAETVATAGLAAATDGTTADFDPITDVRGIRNNRAIRDLIASFANYDNSNAQVRFNNTLTMFLRYGASSSATGETEAVADLRARENSVYERLGLSNATGTSRTTREEVTLAIERWLDGQGVFLPLMVNYATVDGFRFSPLTTEARQALNAPEVLATYDRSRIATYLREMAQLTPEDFMFYDPTGLDELALEERRRYLAAVDRLLEEAGIEQRAAELRYERDEQDRLRAVEEDLRDEDERRRLDALQDRISGYYDELSASVQQYSAGIISSALG